MPNLKPGALKLAIDPEPVLADVIAKVDALLELVCIDSDVTLLLRLRGIRTFGQLAALAPRRLRYFGRRSLHLVRYRE